MYTQILVPLDGSGVATQALPIAAHLARLWDTPLHLCGWASELTFFNLEAQIEAELDLLDMKELEDCPRTLGVTERRVSEEIADLVDATPGTLVCMSTHGRNRSAALMGSVAESVLREAMTPVLLVGPSCENGRFQAEGPLVVCVDGSATSEAAVPLATSWALNLHYPVEVVVVADPSAPDLLADAAVGGFDVGSESGYPHRIAAQIEADLGRSVDYEVLHGRHPSHAIVDHLSIENASLAVMSTHGETGLRRLATGSVTMDVVHRSPCPVLVTRPPHLH